MKKRWPRLKGNFLVATMALCPLQTAHALELITPLACQFGQNCFIQQYVDHGESGQPTRDYRCGAETYQGHNGTDFRIRALTGEDVSVVAPAAGVVLRSRDGVADHLIATPADSAAVQSIECGNAVVLSHGEGYETQLCHMRQGSIRVKPGDRVSAGQPVGLVGASGLAAFAHLHLTVRKDGKDIDPFAPQMDMHQCRAGQDLSMSLWSKAARQALTYHDAEMIDAGFFTGALQAADLEVRPPPQINLQSETPALNFYARYIHIAVGDSLDVAVDGPGGFRIRAQTAPSRSALAVGSLMTGAPRPANGWAAGHYQGRVTLWHQGNIAAFRDVRLDVQTVGAAPR